MVISCSIIPIFITKNSNANLVTDNLKGWQGKYNSDMHWCYDFLNEKERTNFFIYRYQKSNRNEKAFCYMKFFKDSSPQRIEVDLNTYKKYKALMHLEFATPDIKKKAIYLDHKNWLMCPNCDETWEDELAPIHEMVKCPKCNSLFLSPK